MFAAPEISPSMGHTSDTMKSILDHESIRSIKKPDSDISAFDFSSNAGIARQIWKAGTLLRHGWGRCLAFCQIKFYNFLHDRHS